MKFLSNHYIKNLSEDFVLNLFASVVSTGILQLVVYPKLALTLGSEGYGQMLTIMGIINVVILSFGNNLCNARIVQQAKYNKKYYRRFPNNSSNICCGLWNHCLIC